LPSGADVGTVDRVFWVVLVAVVLLVALAAAVVVAVALPQLRSGAQVLTPEGERVVREARARLTNTPHP
jgi:hypothetical protein